MKSKTATQPVNHCIAWRTLLGIVAVLSLVHPLSVQAAITVTITLTSGGQANDKSQAISGQGATNRTDSKAGSNAQQSQ
jgi:hypothetical protein